MLGRELRYSQEIVVGELAGWNDWREDWGREEMRRLARAVVVRERERLKGMQRVLRVLKGGLRKFSFPFPVRREIWLSRGIYVPFDSLTGYGANGCIIIDIRLDRRGVEQSVIPLGGTHI